MAKKQEPVRRGWPLCCLSCGQAAVYINLDNTTTVRCGECESELSIEEIRSRLTAWTSVLAWLETAPPYVEPEE